jgi:DNA repair exonuclease SbcCD ATPase subunit
MRKAFETNVPKLKPRLRSAAVADSSAMPEAPAPLAAADFAEAIAPPNGETEPGHAIPTSTSTEPPLTGSRQEQQATRGRSPQVRPDEALRERVTDEAGSARRRAEARPEQTTDEVGSARRRAEAQPEQRADEASQPEQKFASGAPHPPDMEVRRARLEKIRRKVAEAARPAARRLPPQAPARAGESALGLVRDLEAQLTRAREMEAALLADLDQARGELGRAAAESRGAAERVAEAERQLEEKRSVLAEMLGEMGALEEERDQAVRRAQALTALDEERQRLADELSRRSEELEKALAESRAEGERLSGELDARAAEGARLRAGLAEVTRERDRLARELADAQRERDELAEARHALEQVHQALSQARAKLG